MKAVLLNSDSSLSIENLNIPDPSYGQVLVRVLSAGICGAQLQEIDGTKQTGPRPHPLGHEGVGIVESVGIGVTTVKPTDKVILHWRKGSGIESDFPKYTYATPGPAQGSSLIYTISAGKVACWAEKCLVSENRCTVVPHDTPDELCCLLGCSLSTALGTIEHEAKLLMGESVLIIGCGGLGLNLILAARMRGASRIVGVDKERSKMETVNSMGAVFVESLIPSFAGNPFDVVIDTTGNEDAIEWALRSLAPSGRFIMVGQPNGYIRIPNARSMFDGQGKTIMATQGGRFNPSEDVPRYVAAWRSGHLKVDGIVTHRFALTEINEAVAMVRSGQAGRILLVP